MICVGPGATRNNITKNLAERSIDRRIIQIPTMRQVWRVHGLPLAETRWIDMGTDSALKMAMEVRGYEEVTVEQAKGLLYPKREG